MGRDWHWGGGSNKTSSRKEAYIQNNSSVGCMSGVLNLFDFHQFQFPITQQPCFKPNSILEQYPTFTKGVEAPRNSLEEESSPSKSNMNIETSSFPTKDIPVEIRVLATKVMKNELSSSSNCSSSSPGPKTPSLVARLMGLDILPETVLLLSSSSVTPIKKHIHDQEEAAARSRKQRSKFVENHEVNNNGSRSLPDTPRRRSDVEARFSLQINKEELDYFSRVSKQEKSSRKKELRNVDEDDQENNRSPSHYAKQIVKQVKETVSRRRRRVGLDITNITKNNNDEVVDHVVLLKSKKPKRLTKIGEESNSNKLSHSPRFRICEDEQVKPLSKPRISPSPSPSPSPKPIPENNNGAFKSSRQCSTKLKQMKSQALPQHQTIEKCKKASCERFTQRKETCVVRGSKPHLSKEFCSNVSSTSESCPSTSSHSQIQASKQTCSQLSSSSSRTWCVQTPPLNHQHDNNNNNYSTTTSSSSSSSCLADEIRYVSEILKCTGIKKDTIVCFTTRWFSPSHPLDPSIFSYLENFNSLAIGRLKNRCNRRLMFNLIDELLASFIKPYLNMKPWLNDKQFLRKRINGDELLVFLCIEIKKFPCLNCQTLEDIDDLIEKDLPDEKIRTLPIFEESESIVFEIQQDILDSLVHETAADVIQKRRHKL